MNIICSPSGIVNPFRPGQGVMDIAGAGFEHISLELDMCCSGHELEHFGEERRKEKTGDGQPDKEKAPDRGIKELPPMSEHPEKMRGFFGKMLAECENANLNIPIMIGPYLPRDTKRDDMIPVLKRLHEEAIRYCGSLGCAYLVIRPLTYVRGNEAQWQLNREYYLGLAKLAKDNGVMILLENQFELRNGQVVRGACSHEAMALRWVDELNEAAGEERFGFCMNVAACSLCGQSMYEFAVTLGRRIKAVILGDCDGYHEGYMLPFTSVCYGQPRTDWLSLIRGLRQAGFDGQMVLNICDTAAVFSPLLRPQLMALAKSAAEYFKWQIEMEALLKKYDSIVLFGAGNMCRNYMKCYGEKYPPLFTCDNNEKIWGTTFCGLEVKPPKALQNIPKNCGIFICNIYYREIEKQLRDMGIHQIEFFNDEYMPTFYFDRLKGV
ncbi:MAG: hypothetical protein HFG70_01890 [Hungatella sp.]|nr:hypothetical protein [Hungatella sp.]